MRVFEHSAELHDMVNKNRHTWHQFSSQRSFVIALLAIAAIGLPLLLAVSYSAPNGLDPSADGSKAFMGKAVEQLEHAIELEPKNIDGYRLLSRAYILNNQFDNAVAVWQRAKTANPDQSWPLIEMGKMYEQQGLYLKARDTYFEASSLNPQDSTANQMLERSTSAVASMQAINEYRANQTTAGLEGTSKGDFVLLDYPIGNGWTYLGYIDDEDLLVSGATEQIWSFWRAPTVDIKPTLAVDSWQAIAPGIWASSLQATNKLRDGGFEQPLSGNAPTDFPNSIYSAASGTRQLRRIERDGLLTTAAGLINDKDNRYTSFASGWQSIAKDMAYLVTANTYSDGGNPLLGWRWKGSLPAAYQGAERYAAPVGVNDNWQTLAGLAVPPPGADNLQLWLLNTATDGSAYFDNAVLVPVLLPAPVYPGVPDRNAEQVATWERLSEQLLMYSRSLSDPAWQSAMAQNGPLVTIGQLLSSGWRLQGYSANEPLLARGIPAPLVVYWQGPIGAIPGTSEEGWIDLYDGLWLQVVPDATNLLLNGAFEDGFLGWEDDLFAAPSKTRELTVTQRTEFTTTVGVLTNTIEYSSTSFLSPVLAVAPNTLYLQSGWLNGASGRGYIGVQWQGDFPPDVQARDTYIAGAQAPGSWRHYAGVAEPPPGATGVQVWLLNYLSTGASAFDDITLVPIPAPRPVPVEGEPVESVQAPTSAAADPERARKLLYAYQDDNTRLEDEQWLADVATVGPALVIDQPVAEDWTLLGLTADEDALAAGNITTVFYFWRGPADTVPGSPEQGWYSIDVDTWLQIETGTASLLPNGNFELSTEEASTAGFPLDYATGEPAPDRIQASERNGTATHLAALKNADIDTSGIASIELPVDPQQFYLETGWLRTTEGGRGDLGLSWIGEGLPPDVENPTLAVSGASEDQWAQYARLFVPPAQATGVQVLVYNFQAPGSVEVDDVLVLPVRPPAAAAPAVGTIPVRAILFPS